MHSAVVPVVLKVLGIDLGQAVVFRIRPEVRVEPAQPVCRTSTHGAPQDYLIWIGNRELPQEFFGFPQSFRLFENRVPADGPCILCFPGTGRQSGRPEG